MRRVLSFFAGALAFYCIKAIISEDDKEETVQANAYFKVQSPSERVKGHPIVGTA